MRAYQTFDGLIARDAPGQTAMRRGYALVFGIAVMALFAIVVTSHLEGRDDSTVLVDEKAPSYKDWLNTLNGGPEWTKTFSDDGNDPDWSSQNMNHRDLSDLTPGALPFSSDVGKMQGSDFAKDAYESTAVPDTSDPHGDIPKKLQEFKAAVSEEQTVYDKLKTILDAHNLPNPEAVIVHVAERGPVGPPGARGLRGPTGDIGDDGPLGPIGPPGDDGARGPQGDIGDTGPKGYAGPQGKRGFVGRLGERGPPGPPGIKGIQGQEGLPGDTGPPGPQGNNGAKGLQGAPGGPGPTGADGLDIYRWKIVD